jgi:uncharacterized protein YdhG (YjbR/CyaY superfamily)
MNQLITQYIHEFPIDIQVKFLTLVDKTQKIAKNDVYLSYGMPTWANGRNRLHLGLYKGHIGVYPGPEIIEKIQDKLTEIKYSKGAILFLHKKELPLALFEDILKEVFI